MLWPLSLSIRIGALVSILLGGAIFGFFDAFAICAMWGLDAVDPRAALVAMQGLNAEVRNAAFFPSFFLTPVAMGRTALLCRLGGNRRPAFWFAMGAGIYLSGGLLLTMMVNVPMNEALAPLSVPVDPSEAQALWRS